jgi:hypothetical protein
MEKQAMALIELGENHRRSISITLQLVDQALCEWNDWANGKVQLGIMYRQLDTLSPVQKHELQDKIISLRQLIGFYATISASRQKMSRLLNPSSVTHRCFRKC